MISMMKMGLGAAAMLAIAAVLMLLSLVFFTRRDLVAE